MVRMTLANMLSNIIVARSLEFTARYYAWMSRLANPVTSKDMAVKVCSKRKGNFALVARVRL